MTKQIEDTRDGLNMDLEVMALFNRYLNWIKENNFKDTIYNYYLYVTDIEKIDCGILLH